MIHNGGIQKIEKREILNSNATKIYFLTLKPIEIFKYASLIYKLQNCQVSHKNSDQNKNYKHLSQRSKTQRKYVLCINILSTGKFS